MQDFTCHACGHVLKRGDIGKLGARCAKCDKPVLELLQYLLQTHQHDVLKRVEAQLWPEKPKPKRTRAKRDKSRLPLCDITGADPGRSAKWVGGSAE